MNADATNPRAAAAALHPCRSCDGSGALCTLRDEGGNALRCEPCARCAGSGDDRCYVCGATAALVPSADEAGYNVCAECRDAAPTCWECCEPVTEDLAEVGGRTYHERCRPARRADFVRGRGRCRCGAYATLCGECADCYCDRTGVAVAS